MDDDPYVVISVVNWNGREILSECLASLFGTTDYDNFDVIVVDNGSKDGSVKMVRDQFPGVKVVENETNKGFSTANNQSFKLALERGAEYLLLLNNDTVITDPMWLRAMVGVAESDPDVGIVGCTVREPDGSIHYAGRHFPLSKHLFGDLTERYAYNRYQRNYSPEGYEYVDDVTGAVYLIDAAVIESVGGLDEAYSPAYGEESDYSCRAWDAGFRVAYTDAVEVQHSRNESSARLDPIYLDYVQVRNKTRLVATNYPLSWVVSAVPGLLRIVAGFFLQAEDGIRLREEFVEQPARSARYAIAYVLYFLFHAVNIALKRRSRADVATLLK
ncbi:glycosyltransferase family 2 protein [Halobellus ruber]|uniref:Glycosyltransferase family 2 protein n=1 Tax=Halobellus ruber TaxID=2761102 RepID=A0A7J9SD78_9EURY|nr:glycosyltransferase family 2 protein [Halobellus ruber]MBB6644718.1 glycosyltransferase family 2 protein [Halobellus ruber]